MRGRSWLSLLGGCVVLLVTSRSRAQCTMDAECSTKGVCENGQCALRRRPRHPQPRHHPRAHRLRQTAPLAAPSAALATAPLAPSRMYSAGMVAGGSFLTLLGGVALAVAGSAYFGAAVCGSSGGYDDVPRKSCDKDVDGIVYGSLLAGVSLVAAGVPMIVIGARREPVKSKATATFTPWVTSTSVAVGLRLSM